jgi:hypothetical protein
MAAATRGAAAPPPDGDGKCSAVGGPLLLYHLDLRQHFLSPRLVPCIEEEAGLTFATANSAGEVVVLLPLLCCHPCYHHCVWCVVYGVWCVVCGVWCVVCGVWCVVCGVWCVV